MLFTFNSLKAQWRIIQLDTKASFRSIRNLGDLIIIGGTNGTIVKSNDRGKTWKIIQITGAEKLDFRDIVILNKDEILCMSAGLSQNGAAKIFKSTDCGENWKLMFEMLFCQFAKSQSVRELATDYVLPLEISII